MKAALISLVTLSTIVCSAGILTNGTTVQTKEGVKIPQTVTVKLEDKDTTLSLVGSGVRKKSFLAIKVYLAEVFASNADQFERKNDKALQSLESSPVLAVRTTFLRNVDAETIMNAFKDGFGVNGIDVNKETAIKTFLDVVAKGGDGDEGKTLTFLLVKSADGSEKLVYEDSKGKTTEITGAAGYSKKILSLWLGKMVDGKAQDMQNEIVSGK